MGFITRFGLPSAVLLSLTGCATWNSTEGMRSSCSPNLAANVIVIYEDPRTGAPAADPEKCAVSESSVVLFVTPDGARKGFLIEFDKGDGSAAANGESKFPSEPRGTRGFKASIDETRAHRKDENNVYRYSIVIGDRKTDPSIIIEPH